MTLLVTVYTPGKLTRTVTLPVTAELLTDRTLFVSVTRLAPDVTFSTARLSKEGDEND